MLKKILVGVSGTPSLQSKIDTAIDLAKRKQAEVSILSIIDTDELGKVGPVPIGAQSYAINMKKNRMEKSRAKAEGAIDTFVAACWDADVPYDVIRSEGDPMDVLGKVWRYHDLCLLNVQGWFDYGVLPEPDAALLKLISSGVRPLISVAGKPHKIRRIMIAYNGSMESAKSMKHFAQFNLWPDAKVHVICIGAPKTGEDANDLLERAKEYLAAHAIQAETRHVTGKYDSAIHDVSSELGADLTVMGSSYRRVLMFERFGVHARKMIEDAKGALFMSH